MFSVMGGCLCVFLAGFCFGIKCMYWTNVIFVWIFCLVFEIFWGVWGIAFFFTLSVADLVKLSVLVVAMALWHISICAHASYIYYWV